MSHPLIETKLFLPSPRPGLVPRPRLRQRLDRGLGAKLMLVSAPAGFGKSTLLVDWLASATTRSGAGAAQGRVARPGRRGQRPGPVLAVRGGSVAHCVAGHR